MKHEPFFFPLPNACAATVDPQNNAILVAYLYKKKKRVRFIWGGGLKKDIFNYHFAFLIKQSKEINNTWEKTGFKKTQQET